MLLSTTILPGVLRSVCPAAGTVGVTEGSGWSTACACFSLSTVSGPAVGLAAAVVAPWPGIAASVVDVAPCPKGDASASSMAAGFAATAARLGGTGQYEGIMTIWMVGSDWTRLAESAALFAKTQVDEHGGLHAGSTLWDTLIPILSDAVGGTRSEKHKTTVRKKENMITFRSNCWTQKPKQDALSPKRMTKSHTQQQLTILMGSMAPFSLTSSIRRSIRSRPF